MPRSCASRPSTSGSSRLVDEGALGKVHLVKQSEKHDGPHATWFYDTRRSGGGVTFDMGCHAIEFFRWLLGGRVHRRQGADPRASTPRWAPIVHGDKTDGDDEAILLLTFEGGAVGLAEESWTKPGGMDDRAEVFGSEGQAYADLLYGNALRAFSRRGYGYAVEKAGATAGWSFPIYEEIWNYGFPQEMEHFVACVRAGAPPSENGHDGRAVVEAIHALYASAGRGRRIELPFASDAPPPDRSLASRPAPGGSVIDLRPSPPHVRAAPTAARPARVPPSPARIAPCPRHRGRRSPAACAAAHLGDLVAHARATG